jgi:hypothetical protein
MERLIALLLLALPLFGPRGAGYEVIDLTTRPLSATFSYPKLNAAAPRSTVPNTHWRDYALGDTVTVDVVNYAQQAAVSVPVQLAAVDDLVYVWVEQGTAYAAVDLSRFAQRVTSEVVAPVDGLWGPDTGAFQVHVVLTEQTGDGLDAYYQYQPFDELAAPRMIINSARFPMLDDPLLWSRLAHEYQHLLRHIDTGSVPAWLNEGYSTYTEQALGLASVDYLINTYRAEPRTPLMGWSGTLADYGASLLFVEYFQQRFGSPVLRELARERGHGYQALNRTLSLRSEITAETLFADFVVTQLVGQMTRATSIRQLPYSTRGTLPQTGTDLYQLDPTANAMLRLDFTQPADAPLLPNLTCGQQRFMYALPVDNSRALLTTQLDLRAIDDPTLSFELWYDLEQHWDYAHIAASLDGQTWSYLTTPAMSSDNPWRRARAAGYTGSSGGWASQTLDLSEFAGQQVMLRFEVAHDESKTSWGVALDNVRLGSAGQVETFDTEPVNWQSEGWAWVDGCLPQRTLIQVIGRVNGQNYALRILTDQSFSREFVLPAGSQGEKFIAITPITPYTLHPLVYTLNVSVP